jgi:hypothetical protein
LYDAAMLEMYRQMIDFEDRGDRLLGANASRWPTDAEVATAFHALRKTHKKAVQAWQAIPLDMREGVIGPPGL